MVKYNTATPYIASYLLVRDSQDRVAFVMRSGTKWMDGFYGLPAGKVEQGESFIEGAVREGKEEVGIDVKPENLRAVLTVHRRELGEEMSWVDMFFEVSKYEGEVVNAEPHMHSELAWFALDELPDSVIPSLKVALESIAAGKTYLEYGWNGKSQDIPA